MKKLTPFRTGPWSAIAKGNPSHALALEEEFYKKLQLVATHQARDISFQDLHYVAYNMVIYNRASSLREMTDRLLRKISLTHHKEAYNKVVTQFHNLIDYCERKWVPWARPEILSLAQVATNLYERSVARRWRRACVYLWWVGRIARWLPVFNEHAFAPGAEAPKRAAKHFYDLMH